LATGTQLRVERFKHGLKVSLIADEHERASEVISLTRTDAPGNPPPKGFCEVWEGLFDSARRAEIMAEEVREEAPGTIHVVGVIAQSHQVRGLFYVPTGQSLVG